MTSSNSSIRGILATITATITAAIATTNGVYADMGAMWVESASAGSVTLNWTDPGGVHRPTTVGSSRYEIRWGPVGESPDHLEDLVGSAIRPYTITGLDPDTTYEFHLFTPAEKQNVYGNWVNSKLRRQSILRQRTDTYPSTRQISISGLSDDSLSIRLHNEDHALYSFVRFVYKAEYESAISVDLSLAQSTEGPSAYWETSTAIRGWIDEDSTLDHSIQFPDNVARQSDPLPASEISPLEPCTRYLIIAYGFKRNGASVELGRTFGRTGGTCRITTTEDAIRENHSEILRSYASMVTTGDQSYSSVINQAYAFDDGHLADTQLQLMASEGADLNHDFTALEYMISQEPELWSDWQRVASPTFAEFLSTHHARLYSELTSELDPDPALFRRGDLNGDGLVDISDPAFSLNHLFLGGPEPECMDAGDANDDGEFDISDPTYLLNFLFLGGVPPLPPGTDACGVDPSFDRLTCRVYTGC